VRQAPGSGAGQHGRMCRNAKPAEIMGGVARIEWPTPSPLARRSGARIGRSLLLRPDKNHVRGAVAKVPLGTLQRTSQHARSRIG
jgi:hypothetical protein